MRSVHMTLPALRGRIHIRSFGTGSGGGDELVGRADFNEARFWRRNFWDPAQQAK